MSVPNTEIFSLTDVTAELGGGETSLQACFDNANESGFDPTYNSDGYAPASSMLRFRNYIHTKFIEDMMFHVGVWDEPGDNQHPYDSNFPSVRSGPKGLSTPRYIFTFFQTPVIPIGAVSLTLTFYIESVINTIVNGSDLISIHKTTFNAWPGNYGNPQASKIVSEGGVVLPVPIGTSGKSEMTITLPVSYISGFPSLAISPAAYWGFGTLPTTGKYELVLEKNSSNYNRKISYVFNF